MEINNRINLLRKLMKERNIDAYIIPSVDSHQSEYTGEHFKARRWISGFTGSAGTIVVTSTKAILWTDGRYFIQAEKELEKSEVVLFKMGEENVPSVNKYLVENLNQHDTVGFNGKLFCYSEVNAMKKLFKKKDINLNIEYDLINEIWFDRPELPKGKVFIHDIKYAGKSVGEKLQSIRQIMKEKSIDYYLVSSLDGVAWTFNIRGSDIDYNPVVLSYALISLRSATLFIDSDKLDRSVEQYLHQNNIEIEDYSSVDLRLKNLLSQKTIFFDPSKTSIWCYECISRDVKRLSGEDIIEKLKSIKNNVEIENFRNCQLRDGVAMVKFLYWLDKSVGRSEQTELSISKKLEEFRSQGENYLSLSFETIAGYKEHGAIVHYSASEESDYILKREGMLLLDSGAQYLDGTTDITRTIVLGEISSESRRDFTLVLKGHIALSQARFIYGTTGTQLDTLARIPLWRDKKDYKHGTGHGVGYLLSVHEGPQRISPVYSKVKLEEGMLITNEPGFYKQGEYGIRIENILLVRQVEENEFGKFMEFENTTLCPIDLNGLDKMLLDDNEKTWINNYHKRVFESLFKSLDSDEKKWLEVQTREI